MDHPNEAITELEAALPTRTVEEASQDETDERFLDRFRNPPLPGLEKLMQILATPHGGTEKRD
jgi:hypothetical protein